jgi:DNA-binding MarR family transcriptional regulator
MVSIAIRLRLRRRHALARTSAAKFARGARSAERKLLAALEEHPDQSAGSLARASGDALSTVKNRLNRLSERGAIERGPAGWRLKGAGSRPTTPPPATS